MDDCIPQPYTPAIPLICEVPFNVTPCLNGEQCIEVIDAGCVAYTDVPLPNIGVNPDDRLNVILAKLNANNSHTTISTLKSNSVLFAGTGLTTNPVTATVIVDATIADNILVSGINGLKVELTTTVILALLAAIEANPALQAKFCEVASNCTPTTCGVPTSITATMI